MKKVSILSLLATLAISTAASANVEDPLYAPAKGTVYSKTAITKQDKVYGLVEKVGYGINDKIAIDGTINYIYPDVDGADSGFGSLNIGGTYRLTNGNIITDIYANYERQIDKDMVGEYNEIMAGVKAGKRTAKWTAAAMAGVDHTKFDGADATNDVVLGLAGQYTFDDRVSANVDVAHTIMDADGADDTTVLGVQVNYDKAGLWSVRYEKDLQDSDSEEIISLKYGIQF